MCKSLTCFAHVLCAVRLVLCGTLAAKTPARSVRRQAGPRCASGSSRPKAPRFSRTGRRVGGFALRLASSAACRPGSRLDVQAARFVRRRSLCGLARVGCPFSPAAVRGRAPVASRCATCVSREDVPAAKAVSYPSCAGRCRCINKGPGRTVGSKCIAVVFRLPTQGKEVGRLHTVRLRFSNLQVRSFPSVTFQLGRVLPVCRRRVRSACGGRACIVQVALAGRFLRDAGALQRCMRDGPRRTTDVRARLASRRFKTPLEIKKPHVLKFSRCGSVSSWCAVRDSNPRRTDS